MKENKQELPKQNDNVREDDVEKRFHIQVLGHYKTTIVCDGMDVNMRGDYQFWNYIGDGKVFTIAHYPIRQTIITKIESLKQPKQ